MAKRERSIVEYFAEHERYRCGYCGSSDTNYSHGMWAHSMTVQDYQDLIDRGWRRSGKYCYKPTMNMTCCPQYTIRCDVPNFKLSKSQKKIIKRVNRYLITGQKPGSKDSGDDDSANAGDEGPSGDSFVPGKKSEFSLSASDVKNDRTGASEKPSASEKKGNVGSESKKADVKESVDEKADKKTSPKSAPTKGQGPDNSKPPCRKAKQIRLERKMQKSGLSLDEIKTKNQNKTKEGKSLEDMLNEPLKAENPAHRLEMKLIRSSPKSREFLETYVHAHKVYLKYQTTIHKDPPDKPNLKQYTRFLVDSPLEVKLVRTSPASDESRLTFNKSHQLFKKYQMTIHKEEAHECTKDAYQQFLVDSPLEPVIAEPGERGLPEGYGSFHQHYMLDGKLIAVGVIDILPNCVSSVYLYYDPDYSFLSLGTYSALREVAFVRELHRMVPALRFYYMGFYIHSCPKMRYKGQYYPSFLVCPEAYTWVPIERCAPKLDASHYARLEEPGKEDPETPVDINRVLVLHDREAMAYEVYSFMEKDAHDEDEVKEYAALVGMTCAQRMLLFRK
ncbi:hypothetical protein V1264_016098 [Littorina saxatilis]|uniref:Arginyl-tRNA--protein transferase 1 n=1 Tax=Littorina saxatilis TaxID=31220 RepID=A0AAN9GGR8_9CAEN